MTMGPSPGRRLGTMVAYGFAEIDLAGELALAGRLGATVLEIFPLWSGWPDPAELRERVADAGMAVHSAHGCWGGQTIRASRVDLAQSDPVLHQASVDDLKRCIDWLDEAGGQCLVVHPGGLSDPEQILARRRSVGDGLLHLAEHARGSRVIVCVENMPPGVHPGSRMNDLASLVAELAQPEVALALDTGHAHISADVVLETLAAGASLRTTHVHDNDGRQDTHRPPGEGTIDWSLWSRALDAIGYEGPIMLECIRQLRKSPEVLAEPLFEILRQLCAGSAGDEGSSDQGPR